MNIAEILDKFYQEDGGQFYQEDGHPGGGLTEFVLTDEAFADGSKLHLPYSLLVDVDRKRAWKPWVPLDLELPDVGKPKSQ